MPRTESAQRLRNRIDGTPFVHAGSTQDAQKVGDNLRIEWGRVYLGFPHKSRLMRQSHQGRNSGRRSKTAGCFRKMTSWNRPARSRAPETRSATAFDLLVEPGSESAHLIVAYDDIHSLGFLRQRLDAYWRKDGKTFAEMLNDAEPISATQGRIVAFDDKLLADCASAERRRLRRPMRYRLQASNRRPQARRGGRRNPLFFSKETSQWAHLPSTSPTHRHRSSC